MINRDELKAVLYNRLKELKKRNPNASLRSFSKTLGFNPAEISEFMRGIRKISESRATDIVHQLKLTHDEQERVILRDQGILRGLPRLESTILTETEFEEISPWYHFAILSIAETADFQSNSQWIAERLNISVDCAHHAIERLVRLGMVTRSQDHQLLVSGKAFATAEGAPAAALRRAHKVNFQLASECLDFGEVQDRDFRAVTVAIDPSRLPEARKVLQEFRDRFTKFLEQGEKKEVYQFCMQLFPLSTRTPSSAPLRAMTMIFLSIIAAFSFNVHAFADSGHSLNGGGGVMVCGQQEPKSYRMLDLWEAETIRHIKIRSFQEPNDYLSLRQAVDQVLNQPHIDEGLREELKLWAASLIQQMEEAKDNMPNGVKIAPPLDGGNGFIARDCELRGVALFSDIDLMIYLDNDLIAKMNLVDRVALVLHEAAYKVFRLWFGAENSMGARRFVGCLLSETLCKDLDVYRTINEVPNSSLKCLASKQSGLSRSRPNDVFEFFILINSHPMWVFTKMNSHKVPAATNTMRPVRDYRLAMERPQAIGDETYYPLLSNEAVSRSDFLLSQSGQSMKIHVDVGQDAEVRINQIPVVCRP